MLGNHELTALAERVRVAEAEYKASDHSARVKLGMVWLEAHRAFEITGVGTWKDWVAEHGDSRSLRDVRRLIALASDADPEAAAEVERARARQGMANARERTNVSPPSPTALAKIEEAQPDPKQPTWDAAPAMPAPEPILAPAPEPQPDGDSDIGVVIFGTKRLIEGLNRRSKAAIIAVPLAERISFVRDFMSGWCVKLEDLAASTAPATEPPIAAATEPEPEPQPYQHPAGAPACTLGKCRYSTCASAGKCQAVTAASSGLTPTNDSSRPADMRVWLDEKRHRSPAWSGRPGTAGSCDRIGE
jgi:hypothetical protein